MKMTINTKIYNGKIYKYEYVCSVKKRRLHAKFNCLTCRKGWEKLNNSRRLAYDHARKTGHKVEGEITTNYNYNF